ncbi:MAG: hypothetical protein JW765_06385 [Deltaproteobacteria bacterium]|nr:hypothetical protein [Candidatus Zymogenaceae bacterium]
MTEEGGELISCFMPTVAHVADGERTFDVLLLGPLCMVLERPNRGLARPR